MSGYRQRLVQLWNDWQLIAAVLLSLFLQLLFLVTGSCRRRRPPGWWSKTYFWALYIVSSFIASYSLGILSRASTGDVNADIQAFWAALLLFHLGGVDEFTALSLEDNKLWDRRCFTLVVQVATTAYVFFHYFKDDEFKRFIAPFWLIFLAGLLKCAEQVFALRQATMEALIKAVLGIPDPGPDYADTMDRVDGILRSGVLPSLNIDNERVNGENSDTLPLEGEMEAYKTMEHMWHGSDWYKVKKMRMSTHGNRPTAPGVLLKAYDNQDPAQIVKVNDEVEAYNKQDPGQAVRVIRSAHFLFSRFKILFADGIFSFKDRQDSRSVFLKKGKDWAFKVVEIELSFVYDRLYTKAAVSRTTPGLLIRVASLLLTLAGSIWALFVMLHDGSNYRRRNRFVTYTLLAGAVFTDVFILVCYSFSIWSLVHSDWLKCLAVKLVNRRRWSGCMAQSNLITFCLQKLPWESDTLSEKLVALAARQVKPRMNGLPSGARATLFFARELQASVGFPYSRRSLLEQIRSGSFWDKYTDTKHVPVGDELKTFVFQELRQKERLFMEWERDNKQASGTAPGGGTPLNDNPFTAYRGDQVLKSEKITGLEWSLQEKEFDESLLIWHIATDLCFRQEKGSNSGAVAETTMHMDMARELSNYLFYIMVVHPLMLSPSTTMATKRCRDTCAEARLLFLKEHLLHLRRRAGAASFRGNAAGGVSEENAHEFLIKVETPLPASVVKGDKSKSVLWDGCFLAKELTLAMGDTEKKWKVVCRVWVEMLCYAAIHCGGYQHAERLKEGGELLTFVCLLMNHLGMSKHYRTQVGDAYAQLSAFTA